MSGHNKWSKIKHKKAAKDAKRGNLFTKLAKAITLSASEGGGDIDMNFALRLVVDKAKVANMPNDNIERAIKRGTGELKGGEITRISYEGYGPGGTGLIIDCTTDNTNRALSDIKLIVDKFGGKMAKTGSVSWQFDEKGLIILSLERLKKSEKYGKADTYEPYDKDEMMLKLMEIEGVDDVTDTEITSEDGIESNGLEVITMRNSFADVDKKIRELGFKINSSELAKIAKETVDISDKDMEKITNLVDELDENDDVDTVWINI